MNYEEFEKGWLKAEEDHNDQKLYSLLLSFFKNIIPDLYKSTNITPEFKLISFLKEHIPKIIEKNYQKSAQIRQLLTQLYDSTFNKNPDSKENDSTESTKESTSNLVPQTQPSDTEIDESNVKSIIPTDAKGSEFFKSKIHNLVEEQFSILFQLIENKNNPFREDLIILLSYLIEIYPSIPELIINKLLSYCDHKKISKEEFSILLGKCLDKDASPLIFTIVNYIQEKMIDPHLNPHEIGILESIFLLFQEYIEYFPDYFAPHINLYIGLLGKINDSISNSVAKIIDYYAKNGEEKIDELYFEIYFKLTLVNENIQSILIAALHNSLDNGPTFVLERHFRESHEFDKELIKGLYKNFKHSSKGIQEISFEIAIAIWNFRTQNQIFKQEPLNELLSPVMNILKQILNMKIYSPYLLLQAIRDIDNIVNEVKPSHQAHEFENNLIGEDKLNSQEKFFETLSLFLKQISEL